MFAVFVFIKGLGFKVSFYMKSSSLVRRLSQYTAIWVFYFILLSLDTIPYEMLLLLFFF